MKVRQIAGLGLLLAVVVGTAWAVTNRTKQPQVTGNRLAVSASFYPLFDVAQQVGGDKVNVTNMTPAGAEPHDFEPSPQALAGAFDSKVFIYNGGTMEPWTDKFLGDYHGVVVKGSEGITLQPGTDEATGKPVAGTSDPHYWLDPVLMQTVTDTIEAALAKADPANSGYYLARAKSYKEKLALLDSQFGMGLVRCQTNTIVTSHAAFGYLATRYDLKQVAIAGLSPDSEPSAAQLADLATLVKDQHIGYIFFESLTSPKLAQTLATETGAKTAVLDPIEGLTTARQRAGADYLTIQGENLASLRRALTCR